MVALDIDIEVYSDNPRIEQGFEVMAEVASLRGVREVRFVNELAGPDEGLYWQVRYWDETGDIWNVDTWLVGHDHPHAHWAEKFADAMLGTLTDQTRRAILEIKEGTLTEPGVRGIDVCRAVLEDGVRHPSEFAHWIGENRSSEMVLWLPACAESEIRPGVTGLNELME
jgi:hypothetical protein